MVGNVLTIQDYKAGNPQTQTFHYDALDRLIDAQAAGGTNGNGDYGTDYYTYDKIGNLQSKDGVSYGYSDEGPKHAVTQLNGVQKFWYDANGNMTTRVEGSVTYNQTWDAENRLSSVSGNGQSVTYTYDGDGNRVKKVQNGQTTIYIGNLYEKNVSTGVATSYYFAGSARVAMREQTATTNVVYYFSSDHLGSTSLTMDANGISLSTMGYKPFGETRMGTTPTDRRFTGQHEESSLGSLYDYGARFYSPAIGRFLSADRIVPSAGDPQHLNRYSYVSNNPLKYIDPSGHKECDLAWGCDNTGDPSALYNSPLYNGVLWSQLDPAEQSLILQGGGDEITWNAEKVYGGASNAALTNMDPAVWIVEGLWTWRIGKWLSAPKFPVGTSSELAEGAGEAFSSANLSLSDTVAKHAFDLTKDGHLARPYMQAWRTIAQDIMNAAEPVADPGGIPGGLRWDVAGILNGTSGTWELVVNPADNTIVHLLFRR